MVLLALLTSLSTLAAAETTATVEQRIAYRNGQLRDVRREIARLQAMELKLQGALEELDAQKGPAATNNVSTSSSAEQIVSPPR